jgi:hypothetical protein
LYAVRDSGIECVVSDLPISIYPHTHTHILWQNQKKYALNVKAGMSTFSWAENSSAAIADMMKEPQSESPMSYSVRRKRR